MFRRFPSIAVANPSPSEFLLPKSLAPAPSPAIIPQDRWTARRLRPRQSRLRGRERVPGVLCVRLSERAEKPELADGARATEQPWRSLEATGEELALPMPSIGAGRETIRRRGEPRRHGDRRRCQNEGEQNTDASSGSGRICVHTRRYEHNRCPALLSCRCTRADLRQRDTGDMSTDGQLCASRCALPRAHAVSRQGADLAMRSNPCYYSTSSRYRGSVPWCRSADDVDGHRCSSTPTPMPTLSV